MANRKMLEADFIDLCILSSEYPGMMPIVLTLLLVCIVLDGLHEIKWTTTILRVDIIKLWKCIRGYSGMKSIFPASILL